MQRKISLKDAINFHGHLGPYLVLGLLAGELALNKLKLKKYFGIEVKVWGASKKPKSCLIDGLQLSTGATYGKGNIYKYNGSAVRVDFKSKETGNALSIRLNKDLIKKLDSLKTHVDSENFAQELYAGRLKGFSQYIITTTY
jgi:formylmethanofuran dehydrogenase subunit E